MGKLSTFLSLGNPLLIPTVSNDSFIIVARILRIAGLYRQFLYIVFDFGRFLFI